MSFKLLDKANGEQLRRTYSEFLAKAWGYSWPRDPVFASVPYLEIARSPALFYDTSSFMLPFTLRSPDDPELQAWQVPNILAYFIETSRTSSPFRFHPREVIESNLAAEQKRQEAPGAPGSTVRSLTVLLPAQEQADVQPDVPAPPSITRLAARSVTPPTDPVETPGAMNPVTVLDTMPVSVSGNAGAQSQELRNASDTSGALTLDAGAENCPSPDISHGDDGIVSTGQGRKARTKKPSNLAATRRSSRVVQPRSSTTSTAGTGASGLTSERPQDSVGGKRKKRAYYFWADANGNELPGSDKADSSSNQVDNAGPSAKRARTRKS